MKRSILVGLATFVFACGGKHGGSGNPDGAGDDDGNTGGDGNMVIVDAPLPPGCTAPIPGNPQCSNCIDDDGDGKMDMDDIECTTPQDNDEGSFRTGLPGDNVDGKHQDCFFDGDSGAGNDGCDIHTCCLLGLTTQAACNAAGFPGNYVPSDCPPPVGTRQLSQQCIDTCGNAAPPGCDCFGCCTVCDAQGCVDISENPVVAPMCDGSVIHDPTKCPVCTKVTSCGGGDCNPEMCILCPGQDPSSLPPECNGTASCPTGTTACPNGNECPSGTFCGDSKCCVGIIQ